MARRTKSSSKAISRVTAAVKATAKKVTAKVRGIKAKAKAKTKAPVETAASKSPKSRTASTGMAKRRPQSDVPIDALSKAYTPKQTSLKSPFRATGAAAQRDQESVTDERWNDEDRLTNKSGDPRIGTHGRTYEPGEKRAASKGRK